MKMQIRFLLLAACTLITTDLVQPHGVFADDSSAVSGDVEMFPALPSDCQVHVIGIYAPENSSQDDRVYVKVKDNGKPMVIVLCSYFDVQWNLDLEPNTQVKAVLMSGWFDQSIVNVPDSIPVRKVVGSPRADSTPDQKYFWSYAWHTEQGRTMVDRVKDFTGRDIDTFQGIYEGKRFVIDGKIGGNPGQAGESSASETVPISSRFDSKLGADRAVVEDFVRKSFQLDMDAKQERIRQAEVELTRIKEKFAKRQESSERLIQERIEALLEETAGEKAQAQGADVEEEEEINDPASAGWELWQTQKWDQALRMFEVAVDREPNNGNAWNGLGWSCIHLGKTARAHEAFLKALEIQPNNVGARNGFGRVLMSMGKMDEAEKELLRATQDTIDQFGEKQSVTEGMTAAWWGLIEVKLAKRDFAGAIQWANRYLKHKPDDKQMSLWLQRAEAETP